MQASAAFFSLDYPDNLPGHVNWVYHVPRTNPRSRDKWCNSRSDPWGQVLGFHPFVRSPVPHVITYPFAITPTDFSPSSSNRSETITPVVFVAALPMAPLSIPPFPRGSHFVAINPSVDILSSVPLEDGSPDLLFAVFGRGSITDLNTLLVYAQESLEASIICGHHAWMVLQNDGAVAILRRYFSIAHATFVRAQSPTARHFRDVSP